MSRELLLKKYKIVIIVATAVRAESRSIIPGAIVEILTTTYQKRIQEDPEI